MSIAINSAVNNYTYNYGKKLQPKLDKDDDGRWSRSEVQNYANAYKKATGSTLDVDKIMSTYAGEDGYISAKNQEKLQSADALGLSKLTESTSKLSTPAQSTARDINLNDLLDSMSGAKKASFAANVQKTENMSALLQNFNNSFSGGNTFGFSNLLSQSNVINLYKSSMLSGGSGYQAMASQLMNMMV